MSNFQTPKVHFVAFRNIMMPNNNFNTLQHDYNNTDVHVEMIDENDNDNEIIQLLDNTYETNIIQNTVDSIRKINNNNIQTESLIKNNTTLEYNQDIPTPSNINNISQRLFNELKQTNDFKHITIEDIRNLIFKRNIREWNQPVIKEFVKELRAFSNQKSVFMKNVHVNQSPRPEHDHVELSAL